ncbi:RNA dependent RNA polymerase-domain-containing protein [Xylogone sp. PMI_703]|nr:RNA dependent RNA polymerase-domain-containing protein [Xylogone sp. PMI_703]
MASNPPSTPSTRGDAEFIQLVNDLSSRWDLGLQLGTAKFSPQVRQSQIANESGEAAARCISTIRFLFFKDRNCLQECLEVFETAATRLQSIQSNNASQQWSSQPRADSSSILLNSPRYELLPLLLSILKPHFERVSKRPPPSPIRRRENPVSASNPIAVSSGAQASMASSVDDNAMPLVIREKQEPFPLYQEINTTDRGDSSRRADQVISHMSTGKPIPSVLPTRQAAVASSNMQPILSSLEEHITSHPRKGFRSEPEILEPSSPSASSTTSYSTAPEDSLDGEPAVSSQESIYKHYLPDSGYSSFQVVPPTDYIDESDSFSDIETSYGSTLPDDEYDLPLEEHTEEKLHPFESAFAELPTYLKRAPFYVRYEVVRIFTYVQTPIPPYLELPDCTDYNNLWSYLKNLSVLKGKTLPERTSPKVWAVAMTGERAKTSSGISMTAMIITRRNRIIIEFSPLKLDLQSRLSRNFGADRFLTISIPSPKDGYKTITERRIYEALNTWVSKLHHTFLNRTWQWFSVSSRKDPYVEVEGNALVEETRKTYLHDHYFFATKSPDFDTTLSLHKNMELSEMLNWLIPLDSNKQQPYLKLFSRISLGQSRTWESVTLEPDEIKMLPDIRSDAGFVMNDGCGLMSRKMAIAIREKLGLSELPSAFQGRIGGAKGLWLLDIEDDGSSGMWIKIYQSQSKWKRGEKEIEIHPAHRTFDVSAMSTPCKPARVNEQFLALLDHGETESQIMGETIAHILEEELRYKAEQLNNARESPQKLRRWVHSESGNRKKSGSTSSNVGSLPEESSDQINMLLDAGFLPNKSKFIEERVQKMFAKRLESLQEKFHIVVPKSTNTYIGVDFSGELENDEVHLVFSRPFLNEITGESLLFLDGRDILVSRSPAHLPTDIQKVRARYVPKLKDIKDVALFSRKGPRPLADKLSGGDYDGDRCWICWDENIVKNFENASEPQDIDFYGEGYLTKDKTKYEDILAEGHSDPVQMFLQRSRIFNTRMSLLGTATNYKRDLSLKNHPLDSDASVRLGLLCSKLVDAPKQGDILTHESWSRIKKEIENEASKMHIEKKVNIIDHLKGVIEKVVEECKHKTKKTITQEIDPDLIILAEDFERRSSTDNTCKELYNQLKADLENVNNTWVRLWNQKNKTKAFKEAMDICFPLWNSISVSIENSDIIRQRTILPDLEILSKDFSSWALLKASVTYRRYWRGNFPWWMCGRQLAFIKAMRVGLSPLSSHMAAIMRPVKVAVEKEDDIAGNEMGVNVDSNGIDEDEDDMVYDNED